MYYIIIVSSITYAMKSKDLLTDYGIYCKVEKVKNQYYQRGCSYGVIVRGVDLETAKELLINSRVRIYDVFAYEDDLR